MTQKERMAAKVKAFPYAMSSFYGGKWSCFGRTDDPQKELESYRRTYGKEMKNVRFTDSRTKKVVLQV